MSKKFARFNFVMVSIIVLIGIALSVCSFKLPFFPNDYAGFAGAITMNYDMGEGQSATYEVVPTSEEISTLTDKDMQDTVDFVRQVLAENDNGYNAVSIQNSRELKVDIAKSDISANLLEALSERVEIVIRGEETDAKTDLDIPAARIKKAFPSYQQISDSEYSLGVAIEFDDLGSRMYQKLTEAVGEEGQTVYFYSVDGEKIGSLGNITRGTSMGTTFIPKSDIYTEDSARLYAISIYMGTFANELKIDMNSVVSASLGKDVTLFVCIALATIVVITFAIMLLRYRDFGLLACLSALINIVIYMFLLQSLPLVSMSIATIIGCVAGFMLTMFANILVFEKIRKQYSTGKKIPLSVKMGYKSALMNVVDVSVVSLIISVALYFAGFEMLKGFAITLFIGSLLAMFSALVVTKSFVKWYLILNSTNAKRLALTKETAQDEE